MVGFLALASVVLALIRGGWWWALAIFLVLGWFGQRSEAKKKRALEQMGDFADTPPIASETISSPSSSGHEIERADAGLADEIERICASLSRSDYYVSELIPAGKRATASINYPPFGGGNIIALVDATVFGSAKNGFAIGPHGIGWHNYTMSTPYNDLSWQDFATKTLVAKGSKLIIGEGTVELSGSQTKAEHLIEVLSAIQALLRREQMDGSVARAVSASTSVSVKTIVNERNGTVAQFSPIDVNAALFDELLTLPGIGAAEAHMILKRRGDQPFTTINDVVQFLDLKPHFATRLEGRTMFAKPGQTAEGTSSDAVATATILRGRMID